MYAFIKTEAGTYKIYDQCDDWQIIGPNGFERWVSSYANDKRASLHNAVSRIPDAKVEDLVVAGAV